MQFREMEEMAALKVVALTEIINLEDISNEQE